MIITRASGATPVSKELDLRNGFVEVNLRLHIRAVR